MSIQYIIYFARWFISHATKGFKILFTHFNIASRNMLLNSFTIFCASILILVFHKSFTVKLTSLRDDNQLSGEIGIGSEQVLDYFLEVFPVYSPTEIKLLLYYLRITHLISLKQNSKVGGFPILFLLGQSTKGPVAKYKTRSLV